MEWEASAAFVLLGQDHDPLGLDPEQVTALTGIEPSETWRVGDLIDKHATVRHKQNGWSVESALPPTAELEDHVKDVLDQLQAGWASLKGVSARFDSEISCVLYIKSVNPPVHFDKDTVARIAELGAEIDIDIYVLPGQ